MTLPTSPPCFTPDELASWQAANAVCSPRFQADSPCQDCTSEFAMEMRAVGLCTGRPPAGAPLAIPAIGLRQQVVVQ
jgi:hypothetical protein